MRILVVGGCGAAFAAIAQRRTFFEHCALADYDRARSASLVEGLDDGRFRAHGRLDSTELEAKGAGVLGPEAFAAQPLPRQARRVRLAAPRPRARSVVVDPDARCSSSR